MILDHHQAPVRTGRAAVNGTSLHYRTAGSGPAVVLLHGVPKTGYHWRHLVPQLTPHHTVVVPDLRGLGDSARPADGYDSATMSDDIAALMAHLGHDAYSVAGEDWGAVIGYQLAARHRAHVRSLVFAEALFPGFGFEDHAALTHENVSAGMHFWHLGFYFQPDVPEMLIAGHERELITYMIKNERSHPDSATPDAIEEYVRCYSMPGGIRAMLSIYRAMLVDAEQNRLAARNKLDIPVLALGGSAFIGDRNESQMRMFAHRVTGHVFDAGHDLAEEVPDEMAEVMLPFLAEHA
ncbi:alpha/beta fold hydrolase [Streptomyces mobaraensis NBRC 13819 = DSM 40847]|uniref:Hydrolase n=1 Tax=Streptomyces mobaraensis (strain ATCC 29032 / DSM 40847 / JCM 4168 / NBRC 13819 / NCIMB 11159 / IPCR 16-22) TaxID=1223523 RepID=M2ZZ65_STRM1|nr:alpha/beta fold hydrolase [Streptomyces mobaraensis]EME98078.1 hydrolase [Streptomyces mobaraensis NBRC 13819 = DSM 40847]QTT74801.1 alpha/beta fold hydrolase [Streptomyces mobaraensis NBRC 13819 = DSM 40847]